VTSEHVSPLSVRHDAVKARPSARTSAMRTPPESSLVSVPRTEAAPPLPAEPPPKGPPDPPAVDPSDAETHRRHRALTTTDYARITVWLERGGSDRVLSGFGVSPKELVSVLSRWTKRLARDPALSAEFEAALEMARWE
jgi:hypothetical protein